MKVDRLVWIDIETTGYWSNKIITGEFNTSIIELAMVITDPKASKILSKVTFVIEPSALSLQEMTEENVEFHKRSGLYQELIDDTVPKFTLAQVKNALLRIFLGSSAWDDKNFVLAGSSPLALDLPFLKHYMPELFQENGGYLSYRTFDISSIRHFHWLKTGQSFSTKSNHRALDDVLGNIEEYRQLLRSK